MQPRVNSLLDKLKFAPVSCKHRLRWKSLSFIVHVTAVLFSLLACLPERVLDFLWPVGAIHYTQHDCFKSSSPNAEGRVHRKTQGNRDVRFFRSQLGNRDW